MTRSVMTQSVMTQSVVTLSVMTRSVMTQSVMTRSVMTRREDLVPHRAPTLRYPPAHRPTRSPHPLPPRMYRPVPRPLLRGFLVSPPPVPPRPRARPSRPWESDTSSSAAAAAADDEEAGPGDLPGCGPAPAGSFLKFIRANSAATQTRPSQGPPIGSAEIPGRIRAGLGRPSAGRPCQ